MEGPQGIQICQVFLKVKKRGIRRPSSRAIPTAHMSICIGSFTPWKALNRIIELRGLDVIYYIREAFVRNSRVFSLKVLI